MAILQNSDRQYVLQGEVVVTFDDFSDSAVPTTPGEPQEAVAIPANGIVVGGQWITTAAFDDSADTETFTLAVGDGTDRAYLLAAAAVNATGAGGQHALVPTGQVYTVDDDISVNLISSAGATTMDSGAGVLQVMYTVTGRSNENLD